MGSTIKRWLKKWLGIDLLAAENLRIAKALKFLNERPSYDPSKAELVWTDHEARIAFLENSLTSKASTEKILPKVHKRTFRQFAEAASKASLQENEE